MASTHQLFFHLIFLVLFLVSQIISRPLDHNTTSSLTMRERHEQWMVQHGRVYKSVTEKEMRFRIFEENMKYIENFNNDGANKSYKLGPNAFTDLTTEEFRASRTSPRPQIPSQSKSRNIFRNISTNIIFPVVPEAVDWRRQGAVTPIKNQGSCGCCWAFAATAALEGIHKIKTGKLISFSEQNLLDCVPEGRGCNGGNSLYAYNYMTFKGIAKEEDYPYVGKQGQCKDMKDIFHLPGHDYAPEGDLTSLMQAVSKQPVSVSIDSRGFMHYSGGVYDGDCSRNADHEFTIIGYGTDKETKKNYWLIKNSWGESWGENGFMRLHRNEAKCIITTYTFFHVM